jgi:hypothetical protein
LCGDAIDPDATGPWQATIVHLVPRSRGGSGEMDNLRLARPLVALAEQAATWVVERAEGFVPGGWESWIVQDHAGPVAVWLRRVATATPGTAGRPLVPDP